MSSLIPIKNFEEFEKQIHQSMKLAGENIIFKFGSFIAKYYLDDPQERLVIVLAYQNEVKGVIIRSVFHGVIETLNEKPVTQFQELLEQHQKFLVDAMSSWKEAKLGKIDFGTAKNVAEEAIQEVLVEKLGIAAIMPKKVKWGRPTKIRARFYALPNKSLVLNVIVKNKQVKCPSCGQGMLVFKGLIDGKLIATCPTCGVNYYTKPK